jgi:hypothetical protein
MISNSTYTYLVREGSESGTGGENWWCKLLIRKKVLDQANKFRVREIADQVKCPDPGKKFWIRQTSTGSGKQVPDPANEFLIRQTSSGTGKQVPDPEKQVPDTAEEFLIRQKSCGSGEKLTDPTKSCGSDWIRIRNPPRAVDPRP